MGVTIGNDKTRVELFGGKAMIRPRSILVAVALYLVIVSPGLVRGGALTFRYRVLIHGGNARAARVAEVYTQYAAEK
ncbi:MAG: hypothetical protein HY508_03330 [Acidobacteria bacterium]|nr:hypothetical protein [Acidobacteriota bacterium]